MKKFILLCGTSGSGKTVIANNLVIQNLFPSISFKNLNQVTTREKRPEEIDGKDYIFLDKNEYDQLKNKLIAKTCFYGNYYGTLDESQEYLSNGKFNINIIVVNREGRDSSLKDLKEKYGKNFEAVTIQIVNERNNVKRVGRSKEDLIKEKNELDEVTDFVLLNNTNDWLKEKDFIDVLFKNNFITKLK